MASKILKARLVACVNFWLIDSQYWWQDKIEKIKEWAMMIKTEKKKYQKIEKLIKNNHPYQTPAIFSWKIEKVEENYLKWLKKEMR